MGTLYILSWRYKRQCLNLQLLGYYMVAAVIKILISLNWDIRKVCAFGGFVGKQYCRCLPKLQGVIYTAQAYLVLIYSMSPFI